MASIGKDTGGKKRILFVAPGGKRKTIRLGKCSKHDAATYKYRVENLLSARMLGAEPSRDDSAWLAKLPDAMYDKFARVGLCEPRENALVPLLGPWVKKYIAGRTDVKESTVKTYKKAEKNLIDLFGSSRSLDTITPQNAIEFRIHYLDTGLAENTVRKRCGIAKQFFTAAIRSRLLSENPFSSVRCGVQKNMARAFFITDELAQKVLAACEDDYQKLIFFLAPVGRLAAFGIAHAEMGACAVG